MNRKVILVYKDNEGDLAEEIIWVQSSNEHFKIDNIPFYAPNLALNDIISVEEENGKLYFDSLIKPSGHSTIQIIFFEQNEAERILKSLEKMACTWEGMKNMPYYAVDIPPKTQYSAIKNLLDDENRKNVLDYKEACLSQFHAY